jgi:hypothetical protein
VHGVVLQILSLHHPDLIFVARWNAGRATQLLK